MQKLYFVLLASLFAITLASCSQEEKSKTQNIKEPNAQIQDDSLDWIVDELVIKWNNNKDYSIETLEAMPEEFYGFVPIDSMHSFSEQATHIVSTMHWQMEKLGFKELPEFKDESKAELITSYESLFDYLISELESMEGYELKETVGVFYGASTKRRLLNLLDNHLAHHRGQMMVYLRLKGVKPPKYRGW